MIRKRAKEFLTLIFPPAELWLWKNDLSAEQIANERLEFEKKLDSIGSTFSGADASDTKDAILSIAEAIFKSEQERKKSLEDRAQFYLSLIAISATFILALPLFFTEKWAIPAGISYLIAFFALLTILFFIVAAYQAQTTRSVGRFSLPVAELFPALLSKQGKRAEVKMRYAKYLVKCAKANESALLVKTNSLYLAEALFLRGILSASIVAIIAFCGKVFFSVDSASMPIARVSSDYRILDERLNLQISSQLKELNVVNARLEAATARLNQLQVDLATLNNRNGVSSNIILNCSAGRTTGSSLKSSSSSTVALPQRANCTDPAGSK